MRISARLFIWTGVILTAAGQTRAPVRQDPTHAAEHAWAKKKTYETRVLDDISTPSRWVVTGHGELTFPSGGERRFLRVNVSLEGQTALPVASAVRAVPAEDWSHYNRISFWLRTDAPGFPVLTLLVNIRNQGKTPVAEVHQRESEHNVTVPNGVWTKVYWEIPHVARDAVTSLTFRPWVNKRIASPSDAAVYEIGPIALERVDADAYEGWTVAPQQIAFSHTGYLPNAPKTALASGLKATEFQVARANGGALVLRKRIIRQKGRLGEFDVLDFSEVVEPGTYVLRAGAVETRPFQIAARVWDTTIAKTVDFFYGERCGFHVPGIHDVCHRDWLASLGDQKIVMNGGWHDAGDLSQGLVNTGESTYAMFSLAAEARAAGKRPAWLPALEDEAVWGLEWIHKVRFPGGFRIGFASMNIWTDGIIGNQDDRTAAALNNPNVNFIAASVGAAAARYLKDRSPDLARRSLAIAEEDWRAAIVGVETPATLSTPAFASTDMEHAALGIVASVELYKATGREEYARKAWELSSVVAASQQVAYVGREFPLAGFFYTGPDRSRIFHQFHRGNDQAPLVAMTLLCETFPEHGDWMKWYAVAARYGEYQKRSAVATAPYSVLPAYVYRDDEWQQIAENDRYGSNRESYRQQVLKGTPMGDGFYLRTFPVWFTRRGNYGVLLSQMKALATVARLRQDRAASDLLQQQLEWVVGRNPFCQSTMWGEGYDYAPLYSVSVGDLVGALPVGMMTRDNGDAPYWPASNTYVFKEVWVHSSARWLAVMQDLEAPPRPQPFPFNATARTDANGEVTITVEATGRGHHSFTLRAENLTVEGGRRELDLNGKAPARATWKARVTDARAPWVAVAIADGNPEHRREVTAP
ncbi:MAG: glycoside hydrolase family 9 protein [Candidatus Solibacter sp.]